MSMARPAPDLHPHARGCALHVLKDDDRDADRARSTGYCRTARQDLGEAPRNHPGRHRAKNGPNVEIAAPWSAHRFCVAALIEAMGSGWAAHGGMAGCGQIQARRERRKMAPRLMNNNRRWTITARSACCAPSSRNGRTPSWSTRAPTLSTSPARHRHAQPRKRLDVGTWGVMGIGMGTAIAAAVETGKPCSRGRRLRFGFSGMEVETICRYNLPICMSSSQ